MSTRKSARQLFSVDDTSSKNTLIYFVSQHKYPNYLLQQIQEMYANNKLSEALELIECVIEQENSLIESADFFEVYTKCLLETQGWTPLARAALSQALKLHPHHPGALSLQQLSFAEEDLKDGLYSSSEEQLDALIAEQPLNAFAHFLLGRHLLLKTAETQRAVKLLELATQLRPHFLQSWMVLGLAYKKVQWFEKANAAFQKCLDLDQNISNHSLYKSHQQAL